jgi:hypothetical protein
VPTNKPSSRDPNIPSRRRHLRIETPGEVWVYWKCAGLEDTSRVRDLCLGGLFIETKELRDVGKEVKLHFLVQEGQVRAEAVVRHIQPGAGLGLKFTALSGQDIPHLKALISRLQGSSGSPTPSA